MKNIKLKSLTIVNFKGIKKFTLDDLTDYVSIFGANASGKTTIFDAFCFLLFNKDSTDRKDFEIKPLDKSGITKDRTENEVSATLVVDGEEIQLRHVMKENWVKKRGESEAVFSGNQHLYFWNDVPMQAGEYQAKVDAIIPEHTFKLLTNPLYFNSLKWQDRRVVLQEIAGEITDDEILSERPEFGDLIAQLSGKTMQEIRAKNAAEKKRLKDSISTIPARIDEAERGKPAAADLSYSVSEIERLQAEYNAIEKQIEDRNEAQKEENEAIQEINRQIHEAKTENLSIQAKHQQQYNADLVNAQSAGKKIADQISRQKADLRALEGSVQSMERQKAEILSSIESRRGRMLADKQEITLRIESLRKEFTDLNAKEIDPSKLVCGECGRDHEAHNADEIVAKFNENKTKELKAIIQRGDALKAELAKLEESLNELNSSSTEEIDQNLITQRNNLAAVENEIKRLEAELESVNENSVVVQSVADRLENDEKYQSNLAEIKQLEESLLNRPSVDISDLRQKKDEITVQIDGHKSKLATKDQIEAADKRIAELKEQEKVLAQQLASIEREEFLAASYEKHKAEELERRVNGMFKYARFKMFNQLINGGEEPTCVTTYEGVPFPDLNNAAKVMIGLDIINTLSAHHGVIAPVFLDNRESISSIPDTAAQVINLIVSPEDKELRVA